MTYLQLINNVLTRLREDTISQEEFGANDDPYIRFIASAVNDAKDRVEDSWQWGALRGTDYVPLFADIGSQFALPNSADNHYIIKRIAVFPNTSPTNFQAATQRNFLRWTNVDRVRGFFQNPGSVQKGRPSEFAVTGVASEPQFLEDEVGNIVITVLTPPSGTSVVPDYWLEIDRVNHQDSLVAGTDNLLVPSLPVYTLATALASRERGEVGGTPTSELFSIADRHLGDSIAQDSALYANELDWFANTDEFNTNVRFA